MDYFVPPRASYATPARPLNHPWKPPDPPRPTSPTTSACSAGTGGWCCSAARSASAPAFGVTQAMPKIYESVDLGARAAGRPGHQRGRRPHQGRRSTSTPRPSWSARPRSRPRRPRCCAPADAPDELARASRSRCRPNTTVLVITLQGRQTRAAPRPARTRSPRRTCATARQTAQAGLDAADRHADRQGQAAQRDA